MQKVYTKTVCNMCGGKIFLPVLDLGKMPVSNAFIKKDKLSETEETFPLAVQLCTSCKSLHLRDIVSSHLIFKNYSYMTGASQPLVDHFHLLAEKIVKDHIRSKKDLVIEIGSNDGSLLARIKDKCRVLGVDPAANIAKIARKNGVPTLVGFFNSTLARKIYKEYGKAQVVVANNVMAHIDDIADVFVGVSDILSRDGRFIFEVHWVGNLLTDGGFDQIYHEHFYYHSLHSLKVFLDSVHMVIKDVELVPIHGESMRISVGLSGKSSKRVSDFLKREEKMGLTDPKTYKSFSKKVTSVKKELTQLLHKLKKDKKTIIGYGAPAKGNTLLNYFKIGSDVLDYIVDTTPNKQGAFTPGSRIPIVSPSILEKQTPDFILLLSWNYAYAILKKEKQLRDRGVKFIIPVPFVKVL